MCTCPEFCCAIRASPRCTMLVAGQAQQLRPCPCQAAATGDIHLLRQFPWKAEGWPDCVLPAAVKRQDLGMLDWLCDHECQPTTDTISLALSHRSALLCFANLQILPNHACECCKCSQACPGQACPILHSQKLCGSLLLQIQSDMSQLKISNLRVALRHAR